jgi:peptidoglycan/LPS O-acetylase OafA/YrhL
LQSPKPHRLSYLDSSRGIAALIVLLAHFTLTILPELKDSVLLKTPLGIFVDGQAAVLYFFILSGYVLTLSIKDIFTYSLNKYVKFVIKRCLRIFPAFILALLVSYLLIKLFGVPDNTFLNTYWKGEINFWELLKQSILIFRFPNEPELRLLPHDWTLSIEIAVSLLLPMLAMLSFRNPYLFILFIYLSVKFLKLDPFVFDFSLGIFIVTIQERLINFWRGFRYKFIILLIAVLFITFDYFIPEVMKISDRLLIHHKSWGLAIFLFALIASPLTQKIFSNKILVFLGRISYSFYLFHLIVLMVMTSLFPGMNPIFFLIVYIMITVLVSTLTYIQVEKPFISPGRNLN